MRGRSLDGCLVFGKLSFGIMPGSCVVAISKIGKTKCFGVPSFVSVIRCINGVGDFSINFQELA